MTRHEDAAGITIPGSWRLDFEYAAGAAATRFLLALRDEQRITASPCPRCGRVLAPPREFCERCFVRTSEDWRTVGPGGVLEAFTVTYAAFPGYPPPPYAIAFARPDGADTAIGNLLVGVDLDDPAELHRRLVIGTRVEAVFGEHREARITDFVWSR